MMKRTKISKILMEALYSACFLLVDPSGRIVTGTAVRGDVPNHQSWQSNFSDTHFYLHRLDPTPLFAAKLPIGGEAREAIKTTTKRALAEMFHCAQQQAGRALLCYASRFGRVDSVDLRIRIFPEGNLYAHIRNRVVDSISTSSAETSYYPNVADGAGVRGLNHLKDACLALGWSSRRQHDAGSTGFDLASFYNVLMSMPELNAVSGNGSNEPLPGLMGDLLNLTTEIFSDPIVTRRHEALVKALVNSQRLWLGKEKIEHIAVPATLPNYSERFDDIAKKFNIPEAQGDHEAG